jgi:hypothetical protein
MESRWTSLPSAHWSARSSSRPTSSRAASHATNVAEQRWLLRQPHAIRCSFVEEVVDRRDDPRAAERWMLLQDDAVRQSFVREVLDT